jgi:protein O-mannosyl-transferase
MSDTGLAITPLTRRDGMVAAVLAVCTFVAFAPALKLGFINLDDAHYATDNPHVTGGLTLDNIRWALTAYRPHYWHPLTWLSLQLDASLSWPNPLGFHLTNVLLHSCNAALLFLALRSLTGALVPAVIAAALFAAHPLRVESVAWVTERKDVLGTFFGFLALWAYAAYVQRPSARRYLALAAAFAFSLMSKPMLVTLPCLLLVLDWWPLGRWRARNWKALLLEKLPLLALAAASAGVTYRGHLIKGPVIGLENIPPAVRCGNAAIAYVAYIGQTIWPENLAIYYPHPLHGYNSDKGVAASKAIGAIVLLLTTTGLAVALRRRAPYLLVGWLWFLGTLVPVIGIVQVGQQAYADRFTYFPQVGLLVAFSWGMTALFANNLRVALVAGTALALVLAAVTQGQLATWRDPVILWTHSINVTGPNPPALCNLANALESRGQFSDAVDYYRQALKIDADFAGTHANLGNALSKMGKADEAVREYEEALRLDPKADGVLSNLGLIELNRGNLTGAAERFREALALRPGAAEAHSNLANVYSKQGKLDDAAREHAEAVRVDPGYALGHFNYGIFLMRQRKFDEAAEQHEQAIRLDPKLFEAHFCLGQIEAARGDLPRAADHFQEVLRLRPDSLEARTELGVVFMRQGRVEDGMPYLVEVARRDPQNWQAHSNLGKALQMRGDWPQAATEFQTAVRLSPKSAPVWYELGVTFGRLGRASDAVRCFEQALALEPSSQVFRQALDATRQTPQGGNPPAEHGQPARNSPG